MQPVASDIWGKTMDGRKALILSGAILSGLLGCSHAEPRQSMDPLVSPAPAAKPPAQAGNTPIAIRKDPVEPAKEMQAKPSTCVAMGDVFAQCAADADRTPQDRSDMARKAEEVYQRAIHIDPKYTAAYIGLAKVQELSGDRDGAAKTWQAALTKLPNDASVWFEHGMYMARLQNFEQASASLMQASRLDPRNTEYCKRVGFMLARQGRDEDGLTWLRKAMPEADAQYNIARMMQHIGQGEAARRHLVMALQSQPDHQASQKMLMEGREPAEQARAKEQAQFQAAVPAQYQAATPEDYNNVSAVYQPNPALAVPVRPADFSAPTVKVSAPAPEPRPIPVQPVTIDQFDSRPPVPVFNAPVTPKVEVKPQAAAASSKRTAPDITYTIEPEP